MLNKNENSKALLNEIIKGIEEMKGQDINKIDLREIENSPCEYFVICSGNSNTQVSSIVNSVRKSVSKILKEKPLHIEGLRIAEWVLIDYVNIVVHVFQKKTREFYNIEELWGDAINTPIASNY
ncbi:MAG: ribosome silencing factor [Bacteroidota bacterium]|nr:ribosome silencing factor [Bacteroidota bacterium]